jgi:hypothetical protein
MSIILKDGSVTEDPRLDRLVYFDERPLAYPVLRTIEARQPRSYKWRCPVVLDQGQEGSCVGHAVAHELAARPVGIQNITHEYAVDIYFEAQRTDPWPGGEYPQADPQYSGTAVLAGIKVAQDRGFVSEYHWAFSEPELALAVSYKGPAVLGINWYESMYDTDSNFWVRMSGSPVGGHAILCNGFNVAGQYYTLHNSWGRSWGYNGEGKISRADMAKLLADQGEACIITGRNYVNI